MSVSNNIRCAIYTRKSTDEGLDMDYNTLDAQRDAGEKYISAMHNEGWRIIPECYDDGGYSGGNLKRPGLQKLLEDIKAGRIDTVVVYKIDRLSRSLVDFAKLVEIFEAHNTTFVSVTQHFNTQDPMGRLTLNILLSFAQFERELTGERIRDKFAASKKKGMWMGGSPPLGYDVVDRHLIVNKKEANLVAHIFTRFIELGSLSMLATELNNDGYRTKSYISGSDRKNGGKPFSVNPLRTILKNRLYLGQMHHQGEYYPALHKPIILQKQFDEVQNIFAHNSKGRRQRTYIAKSTALLKGLIVCGTCGGVMSPTYTVRNNKRYHYYRTNSYRDHTCGKCPVTRIPAGEIEEIVKGQLKEVFASPHILTEITRDKDLPVNELHKALQQVGSVWEFLFPAEQKRIIYLLVNKIAIYAHGIDIEYRSEGLENILEELKKTINRN